MIVSVGSALVMMIASKADVRVSVESVRKLVLGGTTDLKAIVTGGCASKRNKIIRLFLQEAGM